MNYVVIDGMTPIWQGEGDAVEFVDDVVEIRNANGIVVAVLDNHDFGLVLLEKDDA